MGILDGKEHSTGRPVARDAVAGGGGGDRRRVGRNAIAGPPWSMARGAERLVGHPFRGPAFGRLRRLNRLARSLIALLWEEPLLAISCWKDSMASSNFPICSANLALAYALLSFGSDESLTSIGALRATPAFSADWDSMIMDSTRIAAGYLPLSTDGSPLNATICRTSPRQTLRRSASSDIALPLKYHVWSASSSRMQPESVSSLCEDIRPRRGKDVESGLEGPLDSRRSGRSGENNIQSGASVRARSISPR
jgi:hypothetical protein